MLVLHCASSRNLGTGAACDPYSVTMDSFYHDLRVGLRLLWKDKAFTITAVLTLALCIGANTALFSIVDHVLLKPLPFPESDRIVLMSNHYPGAGVEIGGNSSAPDY